MSDEYYLHVHWLRISCYKDLDKFVKKGVSGNILGVSGLPDIAKRHLADDVKVTVTKYPNVDVHKMPYPDETFDWVFADFVIEHIENPWQAVNEMKRVLKPGGIVVLTTATLFEIHDAPVDLYRFTPDGLRVLCKDFSKIHVCGAWGSKRVVNCFLEHSPKNWTKPAMRKPTPKMMQMIDDNDPSWPTVVWIVAEK